LTAEIDLKDPKLLIKHFFPCNFQSKKIICESQFGAVTRYRTPSTKMEAAKWEFSTQKWMDVSDKDYGLALINTDRYGASANEKGFAITLVRSAPYPKDDFYTHEKLFSRKNRPKFTDLEHHIFKYVLFPHDGTWQNAHLPKEALKINFPCIVIPPNEINDSNTRENNFNIPIKREEILIHDDFVSTKQISFPYLQCKPSNIQISAIKPSEWQASYETNLSGIKRDGKVLVHNESDWYWDKTNLIVRVFESEGKTTKASLSFKNFSNTIKIREIEEVDLLERKISSSRSSNLINHHTIKFTIQPYEILTYRILFK
jgi:alpha-mannosidase